MTTDRFPLEKDAEHTVLMVDGPEDWWWLTERDAAALLDCGLAAETEPRMPGAHKIIAPTCAFDVACAALTTAVPAEVWKQGEASPMLAVVVHAVEHATTHATPAPLSPVVGRA